jgi:hypothetical protein
MHVGLSHRSSEAVPTLTSTSHSLTPIPQHQYFRVLLLVCKRFSFNLQDIRLLVGMDPLSITSTVLSLTGRCLSTANTLYAIRGKYSNAHMTISAIYSESTVIAASLGYIQNLLLTNPDVLRSNLNARPELANTLDMALTGCLLVYSVLEEEVQKLSAGEGFAPSFKKKVQYIWKEETMNDLLGQIRGKQSALTLLTQVLQMFVKFISHWHTNG